MDEDELVKLMDHATCMMLPESQDDPDECSYNVYNTAASLAILLLLKLEHEERIPRFSDKVSKLACICFAGDDQIEVEREAIAYAMIAALDRYGWVAKPSLNYIPFEYGYNGSVQDCREEEGYTFNTNDIDDLEPETVVLMLEYAGMSIPPDERDHYIEQIISSQDSGEWEWLDEEVCVDCLSGFSCIYHPKLLLIKRIIGAADVPDELRERGKELVERIEHAMAPIMSERYDSFKLDGIPVPLYFFETVFDVSYEEYHGYNPAAMIRLGNILLMPHWDEEMNEMLSLLTPYDSATSENE